MITFKQLSTESVKFISTNYGDINNWLTTQIESAINQLKNLIVLLLQIIK